MFYSIDRWRGCFVRRCFHQLRTCASALRATRPAARFHTQRPPMPNSSWLRSFMQYAAAHRNAFGLTRILSHPRLTTLSLTIAAGGVPKCAAEREPRRTSRHTCACRPTGRNAPGSCSRGARRTWGGGARLCTNYCSETRTETLHAARTSRRPRGARWSAKAVSSWSAPMSSACFSCPPHFAPAPPTHSCARNYSHYRQSCHTSHTYTCTVLVLCSLFSVLCSCSLHTALTDVPRRTSFNFWEVQLYEYS